MLETPENKLLTKEILHHTAVKQGLLTGAFEGISSTEREGYVQQMDSNISREQFYFSIDLQNNRVTHCNGLQQWLGHANNRLSVKKYIEIMHPAHAVAQGFYAVALQDFFAQEKMGLANAMKLNFVSLVALMHQNGKYVYCKKESRVWGIAHNGYVAAYCNEFTIVKDFNNEHYCIRVYDSAGQRHDIADKITKLVKIIFEKRAGFSVQELRILKRYAAGSDMTSGKVAAGFKIEKSTVDTYNKRIMKKAENLFEHRFYNAQQVAGFFSGMCLL